ncbi:MAG: DNA gyrase subunit A [Mycoplasmatales bacterium]
MSDNIINKNITSEMENSFLDYAMSVIVSRALPDVRDGLKPVHRRILYAMNDLNNTADKPYKKSARIVGDVIGKYHPHGDSSVYEAMVRMAQDFSYRLELVDGHGNFGSIDGDGAAAMRYTEARMSRPAMELLRDINKKTIDYTENYDGSELEPVVLPAKFPNILVNGASGIAVGMATNIPPHNLGEVIDGAIVLLENEETTIEELMMYIKGPDFPLGAQILGNSGIIKAYTSGNGSIKVRSKYEIVETKNNKFSIIFNEIPYQVNKSLLLERIADNVRNKVIDGISDIRDESDKDGIRVVIDLRRDVTPEVIVNNLFKHTQLETSFSINMLALVNGQPQVLNLKEILSNYLEHQKEVIIRRTKFDLEKAQRRAHILEALKIAVDNIDEVIKIIRGSNTTEEARNHLKERFEFSDEQTKAILEMRLQKLTGLEIEKIVSELNELLILIGELEGILSSPEKINNIIKEELTEIKEKYSTPRRSEILTNYIDINDDLESLIEEKDVLITLTKDGYIKRISIEEFKTQNRGGKGSRGITLNADDEINNILFTSTHADLLFFTNSGKVFKTRAYKIPEYQSKSAKGLPLINLIDIEKNDVITSIVTLKEYLDNEYLFFTTQKGKGKKTNITEYKRINKNGKKAISLNEEDTVIKVEKVQDNDILFFATKSGIGLKTQISQFRKMGRTARGVTAVRFKEENDTLIGSDILNDENVVITLTENGYGKMTLGTEYRTQSRGGKGTRNLKVSEKTGSVIGIATVKTEDVTNNDLIILSQKGQSIRVSLSTLRSMGRNTQGVRIMKMSADDKVTTFEVIEKSTDEEE